MDTSDVMSIFLRGVLGRRGRRRAGRAVRYVTGHRGFLTASTLLGAAGVAWGIYDSLKSSAAAGAMGAPGAPGAVGPAGAAGALPGATGAVAPPPIPGTVGAPVVLPNDVVRVVRLAISAARADGTLAPAERALILEHAREAGIESHVEQELVSPHPLAEIVAGVGDQQRRRDLYALAFAIVRADENVTGAERIYLAQLAHQLGLEPADASAIETEIAANIDSTPDTEHGNTEARIHGSTEGED